MLSSILCLGSWGSVTFNLTRYTRYVRVCVSNLHLLHHFLLENPNSTQQQQLVDLVTWSIILYAPHLNCRWSVYHIPYQFCCKFLIWSSCSLMILNSWPQTWFVSYMQQATFRWFIDLCVLEKARGRQTNGQEDWMQCIYCSIITLYK